MTEEAGDEGTEVEVFLDEDMVCPAETAETWHFEGSMQGLQHSWSFEKLLLSLPELLPLFRLFLGCWWCVVVPENDSSELLLFSDPDAYPLEIDGSCWFWVLLLNMFWEEDESLLLTCFKLVRGTGLGGGFGRRRHCFEDEGSPVGRTGLGGSLCIFKTPVVDFPNKKSGSKCCSNHNQANVHSQQQVQKSVSLV